MNLRGRILIARPNIVDPFFKKGVVFVFEHSAHACAGLVLNKPRKDIGTHDIMHQRGFTTANANESLYCGGPVKESAVLMMHTSEWQCSNTLAVTSAISITSDDLMIYKYAHGDLPKGYRFFSGQAIWHPQQIAAEIKANHWLVSEFNEHQIFDYTGKDQWTMAVEHNARATIDKYI